MPSRSRVVLREIATQADRAAVLGLQRRPGQEAYLDAMERHFEDADAEPRAMPRAWAVHDATSLDLVGFAMISDGIPEPMDGDLIGPYYLWRLLIDADRQGLGYGTATIDAIVGYLRGRPHATVLFTSCADGPGSPRRFYLRCGFHDTGRIVDGEHVLALDLERGERSDDALR